MPRDDTACHRDALVGIAHQAMIEKGLDPDFDQAVEAQLATLTAPAGADDASIRDLRDRLWCSIDNDDSRDLDQLTVAEELGGGQVRLLVAVADVDALVKKDTPIDAHAQTEHDLRLHGGAGLPDAAGEALHRSHVAERRRGPRGARDRDDGARRRIGGEGRRLSGAASTTTPSSPTTPSARGSRARTAPAKVRDVAGLGENLRCRTGPPTACASCGTSTARSIWRRSRPGPCSRTATSSICARSGATTRACSSRTS